MDSTVLRDHVRRVVGEMSPLGLSEARSEHLLVDDLGYDSLAIIELSLRIEQDFSLTSAGTGGTPDIKTVKDIEDFVEQRAAAPADAG